MLKNYTLFILSLLVSLVAIAQNGDIRGEVQEKGEALSGALVELKKDNVRVKIVVVSPDGAFIFSSIPSGNYELLVTYTGFKDYKEDIYLQSGQSLYKTIEMISATSKVGVVKIFGTKLDEESPTVPDVQSGPYNSGLDAAATDASLTKRGGKLQAGMARPEQLAILKDGVTQLGPTIPTIFNLGQVKVVTVGVPAMYGDFLGGAIEFTSKSILDTAAQRSFMIRSSSPFNAYHQNAIETFWYKPLKKKNDATVLALTHSLFFDYQKDQSPSSVDLYTLNAARKQELLDKPLVSVGSVGEVSMPNQYEASDFEELKARENASSNEGYTSLKLEWKPNENLIFRFEPSLQYTRRNQWSFSNSLLNAEHNPLSTSYTAKLNAQVEHTLKSPYDSKGNFIYDSSLISKISYIVVADYQRLNSKTVDPIHGDNIFSYGHVGEFTSRGQETYQYVTETKTVVDENGNTQVLEGYLAYTGYQDTALSFKGNKDNAQRAAVTKYVVDKNTANTFDQLLQEQGLLNGQNPVNINGMWYAPGSVLSRYSKSDWQKTSLNMMLNFSVNPSRTLKEQHDFQFGMLFEQQRRSYFSLNANGLWQLMPQLLNRQYDQLDESNPLLSTDAKGLFTDTIRYNYVNNTARQSTFDASLRGVVDESNGYTTGGARFIDVNAVDPNSLSLSMFSADELWNNGNTYVNYAGYDYTGKLQRGVRSIGDFIKNREKREIGAYSPNYNAIWLQDKFVLKKIRIRAGLRAERFDANQQVLKDQYVLYPTKQLNEVTSIGGQAVRHPQVVSQDAVVYVDDIQNPAKIVGYRDGHTWYNAEGKQLQGGDPLRIATTNGVIQPLLSNPDNQEIDESSFIDYSPEVILLPRLSFSFPISSNAMFYAYYDKYAQRPNFNQSFTPINTYYYLANGSNTLLPNPGLKAAKRTDYQLGFKQRVGERGILNLRAGYAEIHDDINLVNIDQAYPRSYTTYGNIDFSTVKSFNVDFKTSYNSISMRANYVLQYADGTGSNVNSAAALIQAGQPNLRSLYPLEYDIRHKLNVNVNFALDSLARKPKGIFRGMNVNIFANTLSGTPYTAYAVAVPEALSLGNVSRSQIEGNPFGSRMPWNYTVDLSISKMMLVKNKPVVIQLNALNVLNILNVYNVYAFSSQANNDGYLASAQGQQQLRNELNARSFANYYSLKQNNPGNFGTPRMLTLTVRSSF